MKRHRLFFFLLSLIVMLVPFVLPVYYYGGDDVRYIYLISGAYTGEQCTNAVFTGVILGECIAWLYRQNNDFEWYSIVFYACYYIAYATIIHCILHSKKQQVEKCCLLTIATIIQIHLSLTPQHTLLASYLTFASLIAVLNTNQNRLYGILAVILFLASLEFRFKGAFLPYIICMPLLCQLFIKERQMRRTYSLIATSLIVVTTLSYFCSHHVYQEGEWKEFKEYNEARGYLADNRLAQFHASTIRNTEDSLAYELFYRYRLFDKNILTKDKIQKYKQFYEESSIDSVRYNKNEYIEYFTANGIYFIAFVIILSLLYLISKKKHEHTTVVVSSCILFILCIAQMASTSFPKERVLLCSTVSVLYVTLASTKGRLFNPLIIIVTCLYFTYFFSKNIYSEYISTTSPHEDVTEVESILNKYDGGRVMLPVPTALVPEAFRVHSSPIGQKGIIQGWLHIYPLASKEYQPFTAFTVKGVPLLAKKSASEQISIIQQLLLLHYNQQTTVDTLDESTNYLLLTIKRKE